MKINVLLTVLLITILSYSVSAQQGTMYTQYMFNTQSVNPAYIGSRDAANLMLLTRNQWVGFDGAPKSQTLNLQVPVKKQKIGVGLSLENDKVGPIRNMGIYADFAYVIQTGRNGNLSFGVKGGFDVYQAELSKIFTIDPGDPSFNRNIKGDYLPNMGVGLFYFTNKYYFGASIPRLLRNSISIENNVTTESLGKEERHYYFIAGYVADISRKIKFKPTMQLKAVYGSPLSFDLSANLLLDERLWLGATLRAGDSFGAIVQYRLIPQMWIGYSFDFTVSDLTHYNSGTHEIMISYQFKPSTSSAERNRIKSPRYF